ncbi:hypothetical protein V8B97DRAFT_2068617 [Scleroderma yunnanense]
MTNLRINSVDQLVSHTLIHYSIVSRSPSQSCVGFGWVKSLTATSVALATSRWQPELFWNLRSLHVWLSTSGSLTQNNVLARILDPLASLTLPHMTSLRLTNLWRVDIPLMNMVARLFPMLTTLHLSCSESLDVSCCWICFEESSVSVTHSPIPNHYVNVSTLTTEFALALKPMTNLVHLHLGIFLSDEDMLYDHLNHYDNPGAYERALLEAVSDRDVSTTEEVLSQADRLNGESEERISYKAIEDAEGEWRCPHSEEMLPFPHDSDECAICAVLVSAPNVRTRELEASLAIARKLKSVRTISWSSFFSWMQPASTGERVGDWQRTTTVYILRANGRVRVRRAPWQ